MAALTRAERARIRSLQVGDFDSGRSFLILWVPGGLRNIVEVWDLSYANDRFGRDGQFVTDALASDVAKGSGGWYLHSGNPKWVLSEQTGEYVRAWVRMIESTYGSE